MKLLNFSCLWEFPGHPKITELPRSWSFDLCVVLSLLLLNRFVFLSLCGIYQVILSMRQIQHGNYFTKYM